MSKEHIISHVKDVRTAQSMTQQDIAAAVGVSRQTIVAIEGGNYTPSVLLALKISKTLGKSVEDLFSAK